MAISRIDSGNSGSFNPVYTLDDIIVILAYNATTSTIPSTPAGYTALSSATNSVSGTQAMVVLYKIATSTSETYPTITNATTSVYAIYRGVNAVAPFTQTAGQTSASSTTAISYSGIAAYANPNLDWVLTFGTGNLATAGMSAAGAVPTSMTLVSNGETTGSGFDLAIFDSNKPLASYGFNTKALTNAAATMTKTTELQMGVANFTMKSNRSLRPHQFSPGLAR